MMMLFCLFWFSVPLRNILSEISQSTYRWHPIGGKFYLLAGVEVGDGLDQADAPHLKQIVGTLPPLVKALDDAEHQPQVAADEFLARGAVAAVNQREQFAHALIREYRQG